MKIFTWRSVYSGISVKRTLYKAGISLRRTVFLGTDGFTVKLLWKNLCKKDNYKAGSRETDIEIFAYNNLYKADKFTKQFSRKKTYILFEKLLFTMFYSLAYILNNFFHSVSAHWIALVGPIDLKFRGISSP